MGIGYFRAEPTEHARISAKGKASKEGKGIGRFYLSARDSIELVRTTTIDQPVSFPEVTADKQQVTLQGGFLYRVKDPDKVFSRYDFSIDPRTKAYRSEDPVKLPEHILEVARTHARQIVQQTKLEDLLTMNDGLSRQVFEKIQQSPIVEWGIEVGMLYFSNIAPQPEIARALGATYREGLLKQADRATYDRRAEAVTQERTIKENELKNSIDLEEKRKELVKLEGDNTMARAKYQADAAKLAILVYEGMDSDTLRAHALNELARNAQKIETLTITPELLAGLRKAA